MDELVDVEFICSAQLCGGDTGCHGCDCKVLLRVLVGIEVEDDKTMSLANHQKISDLVLLFR